MNEGEIIFLNLDNEKISMKKIVENKIDSVKSYKEVFVSSGSLLAGNLAQVSIESAKQILTLANILKQAPNGLFTATVSPAQLSKFADGTTTTMVRDASGVLTKHAGFSELGLKTSMNPITFLSTGFKAMAAVSGTYYLHKINLELSKLNLKLDKLQNMHHNSNLGKLNAAKNNLSSISLKETVDPVDLNEIRNYKRTCSNIYHEYRADLEEKFGVIKINKQSSKEIEFKFYFMYEAYRLSLYAAMIEIITRMKMGESLNYINESIKAIDKEYLNGLYKTYESELDKIYFNYSLGDAERLNKSRFKVGVGVEDLFDSFDRVHSHKKMLVGYNVSKIIYSGIEVKRIRSRMKLVNDSLCHMKELMKNKTENDLVGKILQDISNIPQTEKEILYIPESDGRQRIFISSLES